MWCPPPPNTPAALKLGLLLNYTGSPEASADRERAFNLAISHVNAGGGVLGQPVTGIAADATSDPQTAADAARHLIEIEGVHAIVGPNASSAALPIAETVAGPTGIPLISPSATSPQLSTVPDNDFFFRTALSDAIQGPVLASLTRERGFDNVGFIYLDDAYGQGLATAFARAWDGTLRSVALEVNQTTYLEALRESAGAGAQALVVVTPEEQALAPDPDGFGRGALRPVCLWRRSQASAPGAGAWGTPFGRHVRHGRGRRLPTMTRLRNGKPPSLKPMGPCPSWPMSRKPMTRPWRWPSPPRPPAVSRDRRCATGCGGLARPPGHIVLGTPAGIADGLRWLASGQTINYEGATSSLNWDENGDLLQGYVGIWRFTQDERIEEVDTVFVQG